MRGVREVGLIVVEVERVRNVSTEDLARTSWRRRRAKATMAGACLTWCTVVPAQVGQRAIGMARREVATARFLPCAWREGVRERTTQLSSRVVPGTEVTPALQLIAMEPSLFRLFRALQALVSQLIGAIPVCGRDSKKKRKAAPVPRRPNRRR